MAEDDAGMVDRIPGLERAVAENSRYLADASAKIGALFEGQTKHDVRLLALEQAEDARQRAEIREEERTRAALEREKARDQATAERWDRVEKRVERFEQAASRVQWAIILAVLAAAVAFVLKGGLTI